MKFITIALLLFLITSIVLIAGCSSNNAYSNNPPNNPPNNQPNVATQPTTVTTPDQTVANTNTAAQNSNVPAYTNIQTAQDDFNTIDQALNYT